MARRKSLNERRLTPRQVAELIASGARPRPDLAAVFEETFASGEKDQPQVYELDGDRYLLVYDALVPKLKGKGDIYSADEFFRFARWTARVREDFTHQRASSAENWAHYSALKDRLISHIDTLVDELRATMSRPAADLDLSYQSLDLVSAYVESIGVDRARQELYDHLVAYVGEVLRLRIQGTWQVDRQRPPPPYPYLTGPKHDPTMPINVVWEQLSGLERVDLRAAAANEVRRKRKLPELVTPDAATSVPLASPQGLLGMFPVDAYEVRKLYADGLPCTVVFKEDVDLAGVPCRGEAWFSRAGELTGVTLSREQQFGTRRFGAGSFVHYYRGQQDGRVSNVKLAGDQEIDGLPCRGGTVVMFDSKQRLRYLNLAHDHDINGIPCAGGRNIAVSFHANGRISTAALAREHVIADRSFPRGTGFQFDEKGRVIMAILPTH
jgi:hypothetical protein